MSCLLRPFLEQVHRECLQPKLLRLSAFLTVFQIMLPEEKDVVRGGASGHTRKIRTTPDIYWTSPVWRPLLTTFAVQTQVDFHSMNFRKGLRQSLFRRMAQAKKHSSVRRTQNTQLVNKVSSPYKQTLLDVVTFNILYDHLSVAKTELSPGNNEIQPLITIECSESELTVAVEYEDDGEKTLSALKEKCDPPTTVNDDVTRGLSRFPDAIASQTQSTGPKLPQLEITPFKGTLSMTGNLGTV